jgi:hypothetical protein
MPSTRAASSSSSSGAEEKVVYSKIIYEVELTPSSFNLLCNSSVGPRWIAQNDLIQQTDELSFNTLRTDWLGRRQQVLQNYHFHGTALARNTVQPAICPSCELDVKITPEVAITSNKRQRTEQNDLGDFKNLYPTRHKLIVKHKRSTLIAIRDNEYVSLSHFQRFDRASAWKKKDERIVVTKANGDLALQSSSHAHLSSWSQSQGIQPFAKFAQAYWAFAQLVILFHPTRQEELFEFFDMFFGWHRVYEVSALIDYFETFRFNYQGSARPLTDVDSALFAELVTPHTVSARSSSRFLVERKHVRQKETSSLQHGFSSQQRNKVFQDARTNSRCANWQLGSCKETHDHERQINGKMVTLAHSCVACSGAHPLHACPEKASY